VGFADLLEFVDPTEPGISLFGKKLTDAYRRAERGNPLVLVDRVKI